jgi:alkylated DNA repair dioxygenase AlkB
MFQLVRENPRAPRDVVPAADGKGRATFTEMFLSADEADDLVKALRTWGSLFHNAVVNRREVAKRQVLHFRTKRTRDYYHTGDVHRARVFRDSKIGRKLGALRKRVQTEVSRQMGREVKFSSCIVNRYTTTGLGYHSDDTSRLEHDIVAGVSFGAPCGFHIKNKEPGSETWKVEATHGSLIVMQEGMQKHRVHCVTKPRGSGRTRWSVTFRRVIKDPAAA